MQEFNCTKQKSFDQLRRLVTMHKYVCSSAYESTVKLKILVKSNEFQIGDSTELVLKLSICGF